MQIKTKTLFGAMVLLITCAVLVAHAIAQPLPVPVPVDPPPAPEWWRLIALFITPFLLPLGNLMLRIPIIPNKVIPLVNMVVATLSKYWMLLGFGTLGQVAAALGIVPPDVGVAFASIFAVGWFSSIAAHLVPIGLGSLESYLARTFYEKRKRVARETGGPNARSAWESGKRSVY